MNEWILTEIVAALWLIAAAVHAVVNDWEMATTLVCTSAGWAGLAYEERKNAR